MNTDLTTPVLVTSPDREQGRKGAGESMAYSTKVRFELASQADDAAIRRLLRENPIPGTISLALEREPNYFADASLPGERKRTIVAREAERVVCAGSCSTRLRFINGQLRRVGYLGGLRLDASVAGRFDILRRGYELFRELEAASPADLYFTSIAADNMRARSILERGMRGMPRYEFVGEFVTLLLPTKRRSEVGRNSVEGRQATGEKTDAETLVDLLNQHGQQYQFNAHWTTEQLRALEPLGLRLDKFLVSNGAALWDQRGFRQTVIHSYAPWLARLRPALNIVASMLKWPRLPETGSTLSHAFVFPLTVELELKRTKVFAPATALVHLLQELSRTAVRLRLDYLTLGFAANDPRLAAVRKHFRAREYRSRIYVVSWPGLGGVARELDGRCLGPEVALL